MCSHKKNDKKKIMNRIFILLPGSCSGVGLGVLGESKTLAWGLAMAPHRLRALVHLTKTQLSHLVRYHLRTLRQIQGLPQRMACSAVYMLPGALPIEAEIHKKQLCLLYAVINSDIKCLRLCSCNVDQWEACGL